MGFSGYLMKMWDTRNLGSTPHWETFDNNVIYKESYSVAKEVQDLDSGRNANGVLIRNSILDHAPYVIKFTLKPMWNDELDEIFTLFRNCYDGTQNERKIQIKFFDPENNNYRTGYFYMATPTFSINLIKSDKIFYNAMEIEFIEY